MLILRSGLIGPLLPPRQPTDSVNLGNIEADSLFSIAPSLSLAGFFGEISLWAQEVRTSTTARNKTEVKNIR